MVKTSLPLCLRVSLWNHAAYKDIDFTGFRCPLVDTRNWPEPTLRPPGYYWA